MAREAMNFTSMVLTVHYTLIIFGLKLSPTDQLTLVIYAQTKWPKGTC